MTKNVNIDQNNQKRTGEGATVTTNLSMTLNTPTEGVIEGPGGAETFIGANATEVRDRMMTHLRERAQRDNDTLHVTGVDRTDKTGGAETIFEVRPDGFFAAAPDGATTRTSHAKAATPKTAPTTTPPPRDTKSGSTTAGLTNKTQPQRLTQRYATASPESRRKYLLAGLAGLVALLIVVGLIAKLIGGGGSDDAPAAAAASGATPDGCYGGTDPARAALAARTLATSRTITQNGVTAPSPQGAEEAAAAFARLRSNFTVPGNISKKQAAGYFKSRDAAYAQILAPGATAAAKTLITVSQGKGYTVHLDLSQARVKLVSGNGKTAGLDLLLTTLGTGPRDPKKPAKNIVPVGPTQVATHVDLDVVNGQWRLRNVGAPQTSAEDLAQSGTSYSNTKECSK